MTSAAALPACDEAGHDRGAVAFAWLWIAGTLLASMALALLATLPAMPASTDAVARWVDDATFQLTWAGEFLFFATIAWGTGAAGVFAARGTSSPVRRMTALVALSVTLVAFVVVLLALGRLVYPVVDIDLATESIVLLVSVVIGAVHLALLALAVVAFALPVPVRSAAARRANMVAGVTLGVLFIVGSYPWLLPMWLDLVIAGAVGCWGVLIGVTVLVRDPASASSPADSNTVP